MTREPVPSPRAATVREALHAALREGPASAKELSGVVGISEKDVADHLEHLSRSLKRGKERLVVIPARCLACGHVFADRAKLTRPGSCPDCRATRIEPPRFAIEGG